MGHLNRITAGTMGTSSATSGSTLAVPYATYDANGHIKTVGTHTHTVSGFAASSHTHNESAISWTNNTLYTIGDDVKIGDGNVSGCLVLQGANAATGLYFKPYSGSSAQKISIDGSNNMTITGNVNITGTIKQNGTTVSLSNHNHNSTYVRGTCKIVAGTVVRSISAAATATVFTYAQCNSLLGVSNSTYANTVVYACNGDYGSQNHRIYSVDCVPGSSLWQVRFGDNSAAGNYRFNYIVAYFG